MHSNKTTHNDSVRRALKAIERTYRDAITFEMTPAAYLEPVASQDGELDMLPVCEVTIYPDTLVVEVTTADEIDFLGVVRPAQTLDSSNFDHIRNHCAKWLAKGLEKPKTITFTGESAREFMGDRPVHPAWCNPAQRDKCWSGLALDMIEHESTIEKLTTESFTAEALLTVKTDHYRYTHDVHREEVAQITVVNKDIGALEMVKGTPADLKELGQFIIEQADRFEEYVNDVSEV